MGGEGSMLHMINTIKANRALRRSKRRKFKNSNMSMTSYKDRYVKEVEISDKDLLIIKEQIKTKIKRDRRKHLVFSVVLFSIFIFIVVHYWGNIF